VSLTIAQVNAALGGAYHVEGELGAGGMATVYAARDEKHGRWVAIKVLHPSIAADLPAAKFLREIRIIAQFSHPGIIGLIDSGTLHVQDAEIPYYVMPRIDGESLRDRMRREGAMRIDEAVEIARQVADALGYAHARNVIHRDIKPENILLIGTRALVADFGIAKAVRELGMTTAASTMEGMISGTPAYMSPEQVVADPVGPASDIFSLGIVLYEMLTAELPFAGTTPQAQLTRRLHDTPSPTRTLRPTVSPALDQAVSRMLARQPNDRFATAQDVVAALATPAPAAAPSAAPVQQPSAGGARTRRFVVGGVLAALAVVAGVFAWRASGIVRSGGEDIRSIAVLPFAYVGPDARSEYYGDGLADEITDALGRVPGLKVAARSSAFQFKGKNVEAREIGERLGVGAVVEGSVRPVGTQLRISAQLINSRDGLVIWSESYERPADQAFNVQQALASAIAKALKLEGSSKPAATAPNVRAYEAYLQGRWLWEKRDREGLLQAIDYFQRAIREDSSYAKAWAGLGDAYSLLGGFAYLVPAEAFDKARQAAERAIALDSTLADAHTALGFIHLFYDRDWHGAQTELETALRLDPSYGEARLFYAWYLTAMNQADAAADSLRAAVRNEPVSLILNLRLGSVLILAGRTDEAKKQLEYVVQLSDAYPLAHLDLTKVAALRGEYAVALRELERAPNMAASYGSGTRGVVLARMGRREDALAEATRLSGGTNATTSALGAAHTYAALGDKDRAFAELEAAYTNRDWALFFVRSDPFLMSLHGDPRWPEFVKRMGFP
jgi:serine/threonine-protein kinase